MACGKQICGNQVLSEAISPDGQYVATVFERNCGATTPYIRVVGLREATASFDAERDVDWVFTMHEQSNVVAIWDSERELEIRSEEKHDKPTQRPKWRDVEIRFASAASGQ